MHHYMEVAFVLEGEIVLLKKNKEQFLKKGEMAIVMPYEIHGYEKKGKSEMLVIGFQPEYISEYKKMLYGRFSNDRNFAEYCLNECFHKFRRFSISIYEGFSISHNFKMKNTIIQDLLSKQKEK